MKNFLMLFLLAGLSLAVGCDKTEINTHAAQLTGIDFRKCASPYCSGWFIEIDGETMRFFELPTDTDIELNGELQFPIPVEVEWKKYSNEWGEIQDLIKVEKLYKKG